MVSAELIMIYMTTIMGIFFVVVSFLKFADWKGFARAYSMYDLIAKRSKVYAYLYPIIELVIGILLILSFQIKIVAFFLLLLMIVSSIGVARNLLSKNPVKCACLGTLINIPLTKFTFVEDIVMGVMALVILLL